MKICAILSILALAAPSAVATKRKRIFKVYSPSEIRRLEGTTDEELRLLKGDKPKNEDMSMSMPTNSPTNLPGSSYCTWSPEPECYPDTNGWPACCEDDEVECPEERPECEIAETTEETTSPTTNGTDAPSPAPMRQISMETSSPTTMMMTEPPVVIVTDPPVVVVTGPPAVAVVTGVPTTTVETGGFTMPPDTQPAPVDSATGTDDENSGASIIGISLAAVATVGALIFF